MADAVYRKKILSIDADRGTAATLRPRFEEAGYEFEAAYSGPEGLIKMGSYKPDLVLLDIICGWMDGYAVLRRIKTDPKTKDVPVIMLTAKRQREDVIRSVQLGAKDYLTKPFEFRKILDRVKRALPTD